MGLKLCKKMILQNPIFRGFSEIIFLNGYLFSIITDYLCRKDVIKFSLNCNKKLVYMISHITNRHFINNIYLLEFFNSLLKLDKSILFSNVKELNFSNDYCLTKNFVLNIIMKCPNLIEIDFSNLVIIQDNSEDFLNSDNIFASITSGIIPIDDIIDYICLNHTNMKKITVFNVECSNESLYKIINTYDKLEEFKIFGGRDNLIIDDYLVTQLFKFKNTIENLCFEYCSEITSESLIPFLKNNSKLKSLDITSCLNLDNTIITTLIESNIYHLNELIINEELFEEEIIDQLKLKYCSLRIIYNNNYQDNYYDNDQVSVDSDDRWSYPSYLGWVDDYYD